MCPFIGFNEIRKCTLVDINYFITYNVSLSVKLHVVITDYSL